MHGKIFTSLLLSLATASSLIPRDLCSSVSFNLPVTAENGVFSGPPDPSNETQIIAFAESRFSGDFSFATGTQVVNGTFTINGIYCRPLLATQNALQILVHGLTYNKTYWSGLGFGNMYNWHAFANLNGYATLAIDRLGHGTNPQRPDPFNVVQAPLQIETVHQLISTIRTTTSNPLGRTFSKIAYVGHSYGSFLGAGLAGQHPSDIDALVLTGYSTTLNFTTAGSLNFGSASTVFPRRFNEPLGYLTVSQESAHHNTFYAGSYDPAFPPADYLFEDTLTDGEIAGIPALFVPSVGFTKPVLVVAGVLDALLCAPPASACLSLLAASGQLFPNVSTFEYSAVPNTGHDLNLHYSAPTTFARVHTFLNQYL